MIKDVALTVVGFNRAGISSASRPSELILFDTLSMRVHSVRIDSLFTPQYLKVKFTNAEIDPINKTINTMGWTFDARYALNINECYTVIGKYANGKYLLANREGNTFISDNIEYNSICAHPIKSIVDHKSFMQKANVLGLNFESMLGSKLCKEVTSGTNIRTLAEYIIQTFACDTTAVTIILTEMFKDLGYGEGVSCHVTERKDINSLYITLTGIIELEYFKVPEGINRLAEVQFPNLVKLETCKTLKTANNCINYAPKLESIVFANGTTTISKSAFAGCLALKEVYFSSTVINISEYAFSKCINLETVMFTSKNKLTIDSCAFYGCENLRNMIGKGVNLTICGDALKGCSKLQSINVSNVIFYKKCI